MVFPARFKDCVLLQFLQSENLNVRSNEKKKNFFESNPQKTITEIEKNRREKNQMGRFVHALTNMTV